MMNFIPSEKMYDYSDAKLNATLVESMKPTEDSCPVPMFVLQRLTVAIIGLFVSVEVGVIMGIASAIVIGALVESLIDNVHEQARIRFSCESFINDLQVRECLLEKARRGQ
ncbi:hypothetical protein [Ferrimonas balearica]|uniref:hypothetical protein n=1 Tax=Ferrimonas balearica TaxID=44012 RepID=UPI001C98F06D|nr:hypothetical protein [Ferrimonas balearica]MBY5992521.1 hypothetical protein [Ferrimonas balearica]